MAEGKKFDGGKPPLSLVPRELMAQVAQVMSFGASKYGRDNWRNGMDYTRLVSAAMRHITSWNEGEDLDPESGLSHLAHAAAGLGFLLTYLSEPDKLKFDDRYKGDE